MWNRNETKPWLLILLIAGQNTPKSFAIDYEIWYPFLNSRFSLKPWVSMIKPLNQLDETWSKHVKLLPGTPTCERLAWALGAPLWPTAEVKGRGGLVTWHPCGGKLIKCLPWYFYRKVGVNSKWSSRKSRVMWLTLFSGRVSSNRLYSSYWMLYFEICAFGRICLEKPRIYQNGWIMHWFVWKYGTPKSVRCLIIFPPNSQTHCCREVDFCPRGIQHWQWKIGELL